MSDKAADKVRTATVQNIKEIVRDSSRKRLGLLSQREPIALSDLEESPVVYATWMTMILVAGRDLRITLKCHFMTAAARYFAHKAYGKGPMEISPEQAADFMKELVNVVAGQIKHELETNKISSGISLPLLTRGFDEIFFPAGSGADFVKDEWHLKHSQYGVDFSAHYEFYSADVDIKKKASGQDGHGDVEFL